MPLEVLTNLATDLAWQSQEFPVFVPVFHFIGTPTAPGKTLALPRSEANFRVPLRQVQGGVPRRPRDAVAHPLGVWRASSAVIFSSRRGSSTGLVS